MFKTLPYVAAGLLGGLIVPLQLAMVNAFRQSTQASQIQATFYLYLGGTVTSLILAWALDGSVKPALPQQAAWWMWLPGCLGSLYILLMFVAAPQIGSAATLLWIFLGQMLFAVWMSATGFLGLEVRALDPLKLAALSLIFIGGLLLIYAESR